MRTTLSGVAVLLAVLGDVAAAQATRPAGKELFVPASVWRVPKNNDYTNNDSEFSYRRMADSTNVAVFWAKAFGDRPADNADASKRFDLSTTIAEAERFYDFYVDRLKFVQKGRSLTDRYKMLVYVVDGKDGTAYGGGEGDKIGILWTPPVRISRPPYGAIAHELGHSFQYMVHADGAWGFSSAPEGARGQTIFEMTSQYMLWQVYPDWIVFENYHLVGFMKQTHLAFLHEANQYHSPFVLEYWSEKHGTDFVGKLWRDARPGEDAVTAYKRMTNTDQPAFNDEMFDAARRFITWDLARVEKVSAPYANQHTTALTDAGDGWFQIAESRCPQNYGYNGIKLKTPAGGTAVTLAFKGTAGAAGFRSIRPERAGWRYGFVAVKQDGGRVYGDVNAKTDGQATFVVPAGTQHLWLVVLGAPTEHWEHLSDGKPENDEQWPYRIKLMGTTVDASTVQNAGK